MIIVAQISNLFGFISALKLFDSFTNIPGQVIS